MLATRWWKSNYFIWSLCSSLFCKSISEFLIAFFFNRKNGHRNDNFFRVCRLWWRRNTGRSGASFTWQCQSVWSFTNSTERSHRCFKLQNRGENTQNRQNLKSSVGFCRFVYSCTWSYPHSKSIEQTLVRDRRPKLMQDEMCSAYSVTDLSRTAVVRRFWQDSRACSSLLFLGIGIIDCTLNFIKKYILIDISYVKCSFIFSKCLWYLSVLIFHLVK